MRLLRNILHERRPQVALEVPCPHTALVPRWGNAEDMRKRERVSAYFCTGCNQTLSVLDAQAAARQGA
jgi:hypothetical protein